MGAVGVLIVNGEWINHVLGIGHEVAGVLGAQIGHEVGVVKGNATVNHRD